ncbi:MAG: efflux RND transporter periplasmic adaptor subunit [Bradymonadaceae bacterium]
MTSRWTTMIAVALLATAVTGCESSSKGATSPGESSGSGSSEHEQKKAHESGGHGSGKHESGGHEGAKSVQLSKRAVERYGIQVETARGGNLAGRVSATAKVRHEPSRVARVTPLVRGQVSELKVTVGDTVEAGQTLAVIRSSKLGKARAAVEAAQAEVEVARADYQRVKKLHEKNVVSERKLLDARQKKKTAEAKLAQARSTLEAFGVSGGSGPFYPIEAGVEGRVIEQKATVGEVKGPKSTLFRVASNQPVWVIGQITESDIRKVEPGMQATVTVQAYPARQWKGTVDWVADTVDRDTRTLEVRVELSNDDGALRPGMFGAVHVKPEKGSKYAVVPVGAVQQAHGQQVVFVPGEKDRHFRAQPVETGAERSGLVEIRNGLSAGDEFVTKGAFDLKATLTASSRSGGHH